MTGRTAYGHGWLSALAPGGPIVLSTILALASGCSLATGGLPPVVVLMSPAGDSGNVPVTATVTATFSRPMDPATITGASFTLTQNGAAVAGSVTCGGKTATFTPAGLLPGNTTFVATITTAVTDTAGVPMASNHSWAFMTTPALSAVAMAQYYTYTFNGAPWTRSTTPVSLANGTNTLSEMVNADGSVTLTIANATVGQYEDNGFYFYVGTLRYLSSLRVVGSGTGTFVSNLYLDVDGNGEFFSWSPPNVYSALGGDLYYAGPSSIAGVLTVDSTTVFGTYTLPQLRAGALAGVNADTRAGIWLGISVGAGGSQTTTIVSVRRNE